MKLGLILSLGAAAFGALLVGSGKKQASAAPGTPVPPGGGWSKPPTPANAPGGTPAGTPAITPYGAGTYQPDGTVILPNGTVINPATGEVRPAAIPPSSSPPVPSSGTEPDTGGIPARIGERMARALATNDPVAIRAEAAALRKDGYPREADQLLAAAVLLEGTQVKPVPVPPSKLPVPIPPPGVKDPVPTATPEVIQNGGTYVVKKGDSPWKIAIAYTGDGNRYRELATANPSKKTNILAGKIQVGEVLKLPATWVLPRPTSPTVDTLPEEPMSPARQLATDTQRMLMVNKPGTEDKAQVRVYQAGNQPDAGAIDGLYGPKTALTNIRYGLVPVEPYYWPKATATQAKRDYKNALLAQAVRDPVRAQEWQAAANRPR